MKNRTMIAQPLNTDDRSTLFYLDDNHKLPVTLRLESGTVKELVAIFDPGKLNYSINPRFVGNLAALFTLQIGEQASACFSKGPSYFSARIALPESNCQIRVCINDQRVGLFDYDSGTITASAQNPNLRMNASETRMLSRSLTPYQLDYLPYPRDVSAHLTEDCLPSTDIHTHLSAQLTGEDWEAIILQRDDVFYPLDLLEIVKKIVQSDVDLSQIDTHHLPRRVDFKPAFNLGYAVASERPVLYDENGNPTEHYACKNLKALHDHPATHVFFKQFIEQLSIPIDRIIGADEMDTLFYRFRNPLEKNTLLQEDKILKLAERHQRLGIRYAELSTSEVLIPTWLAAAIPAIEKAEKRFPDVHLRLLAGIHRTKPPEAIARDMEKVKIASQCPYVVGVDFMGYEFNKGEDFDWSLHEMARWTRRSHIRREHGETGAPFTDDFVIRIHAGETSKSRNNVRHAIEIAEKFGIHVRVAHVLQGDIDEHLLAKARANNVILEFIPDSNIALNNADYPHDVPIRQWAASGCQVVINSDGAGAYQTTPLQLAKTALFAGLSLDDLRRMHKLEQEYIAKRLQHFSAKKKAFAQQFGDVAAFIRFFDSESRATRKRHLPISYDNKIPILIAGSSGTNWSKTRPEHRKEISIATRMMTHLLDPNAVYFCTGRVKDRGVEKELDKSVIADDQQHYRTQPGFDMIATYSGNHQGLTIASGVNWVNRAIGSEEHIANNVIQFMQSHPGYSLFIGGGAFTREFIREADERQLHFGLVLGPYGSTNDIARHIDERHHIKAGGQFALAEAIMMHMVEHIGSQRLRPDFQQTDLIATVHNSYMKIQRDIEQEIAQAGGDI